ncbi:sodium transport system permease protein [Deinobacterium chartae]|uniref:Sodium transport system permease protein n=1 Tax=Deinobacterium chartae TaxID=521158 RepID=A0A841HTA4_9DEIO|nr:sodium transport system permease protein [Deinobacterium chartae]
MRTNFVWQVAYKEILSTLRDRRTLVSTILLPLLLIPVFLLGFPLLIGGLLGGETARVQKVGVVGLERLPGLLRRDLERGSGAGSAGVELVAVKDPLAAVQSGEVEAALRLTVPLPDHAGGPPVPIEVFTKLGNLKSSGVTSKIEGAVERYNEALVTRRLEAEGLSRDVLTPVRIESRDASTVAERRSGQLAFLIPLFILQFILAGGQPTAIDSTAGEKERGTLEVLLVTPVSRLEVVAGKFVATTLFALTSAVFSMVGLAAAGWVGRSLLGSLVAGSGNGDAAELATLFGGNLSLSLPAFGALLAVAVTTAMLISVLQLTITVFARSYKEAQTYLVPLALVAILPAVTLQFADFLTVGSGFYLIPLVNAMLVILNIVKGSLGAAAIILTVISNLVYAALLLLLAWRLFRRESVIFRH